MLISISVNDQDDFFISFPQKYALYTGQNLYNYS